MPKALCLDQTMSMHVGAEIEQLPKTQQAHRLKNCEAMATRKQPPSVDPRSEAGSKLNRNREQIAISMSPTNPLSAGNRERTSPSGA